MKYLTLFLFVILMACTKMATTPEQLWRCGTRPSQEDAERVAAMTPTAMNFLDPGAAQISNVQIQGPKTWKETFYNGGTLYGWEVSFYMNGKNAFGGYTGIKRYLLLMQSNGRFNCRPADAWHQ